MLSSAIRSTSVSVVALMAPMCRTAVDPPGLAGEPVLRAGGAMSPAISCFARLRQRSSWRSQSQTTTSWPRSLKAATRLEPIKPAPPVTRYIGSAGRDRTGGQA